MQRRKAARTGRDPQARHRWESSSSRAADAPATRGELDPPLAMAGRVLRTIGIGLLAAVVVAAVYAALVMGSHYYIAPLIAWLVGAVGWVVAIPETRVHQAWVGVIAVACTLFSLLLSEYLIVHLGHLESVTEDLVLLLLLWGPPLVIAGGVGFADLSGDPESDPGDGTDLDADGAPIGEGTQVGAELVPLAQGPESVTGEVSRDARAADDVDVPDRVVLRGRSWWYFTPGLLFVAVLAGAYALQPTSFYDSAADVPADWLNFLLVGVCVVLVPFALLGAVRAPLGGIHADRNGIRVVNLVRTHSLSWDQVRSIDFNESGWDSAGDQAIEWILAFRTSEARRGTRGYTCITSQFPRGDKDPDGRVGEARTTLLRMRDRALGTHDAPTPAVAGAQGDRPSTPQWIRDGATIPQPLRIMMRGDDTVPKRVVLRARRYYTGLGWGAAIFCSLPAVGLDQPPPEGDAVASRVLAVTAVSLALLSLWGQLGIRMRATPSGVLLFGLFRWRRVRWDEVTDIEVKVGAESDRPEKPLEYLGIATRRASLKPWVAETQRGDLARVQLLQAREVLLAMRERYGGHQRIPTQHG